MKHVGELTISWFVFISESAVIFILFLKWQQSWSVITIIILIKLIVMISLTIMCCGWNVTILID